MLGGRPRLISQTFSIFWGSQMMVIKLARLSGRGGSSFQLRKVLALYSTSAVITPATAAPASAKAEEGRKKVGLSALILLLPCAATFGLGTWQLFRREKKIELLDFRRSRFNEEPILLEDALAESRGAKSQLSTPTDNLEYRKVFVEGIFDEAKSLFVGPRARTLYGAAEKGYYMVSPLYYRPHTDGRVQLPVLVNRGWVPASVRDESLKKGVKPSAEVPEEKERHSPDSWWSRWGKPRVPLKEEAAKEDTVRVAGVIRDGEQPNMFVPQNQPEIGQWFYVDVPSMAQTMGLSKDISYMEAVSGPSDGGGRKQFPLPKEFDAFLKSSVMPQDHLNYALTWYSLSAATTFMALKRLQSQRRGR